MSSSDDYLRNLLKKYETKNYLGLQSALSKIAPFISSWSNGYLVESKISGSIAKGTSVSLSSDTDVFLSLCSTVTNPLSEIYETLYTTLSRTGYKTRKQNVSIGLSVDGYNIDYVPGKKQSQHSYNHSLFKSKLNTWTKTNVDTHISAVKNSGRLEEIKILKLWRTRKALEFPSFYLELVVMDALKYSPFGDISNNVWKVLNFLHTDFSTRTYIDPANSNNVISDDLSLLEKRLISGAAKEAIGKQYWSEIVW